MNDHTNGKALIEWLNDHVKDFYSTAKLYSWLIEEILKFEQFKICLEANIIFLGPEKLGKNSYFCHFDK